MRGRVWMLPMLLLCASPVWAQPYSNARRLGGPSSFYKPALTNVASLKRMADRPAIANDVRKVFGDAGIPEAADAFLAAVTAATSASSGPRAPSAVSCDAVAPGEGVFECQEPVGSTFEWMAYRPIVKGRRVPDRLLRVRWAGKRPFAAFLVRVTVRDRLYTFVVPKPCANVALVSVVTSPAAAAAAQQ